MGLFQGGIGSGVLFLVTCHADHQRPDQSKYLPGPIYIIERILKDAGFAKLKRRADKELGISKKNKIIPQRSEHLDMSTLKPFQLDVPVAGVFFFLPYVIGSGLINIIKKCQLPQSSKIGGIQACLSMLVLKLIGNQRLSHMDSYDCEPGLGIWAGLNVLPKSTYMSTYSCRSSEAMLTQFQKEIIEHFKKVYPEFYGSDFINLDFHSIPHYGEEAEMEKVWCGARWESCLAPSFLYSIFFLCDMVICKVLHFSIP